VTTWLRVFPRPLVLLDPDGAVQELSDAAARLLDLGPEPRGRQVGELAADAGERAAFEEALSAVAGGAPWEGTLRLRTTEGSRRYGVVLSHTPEGLLLLVEPIPASSVRARQPSVAVTRLARVAAELQSTNDQERLTNVIVSHMADAAGATTASVSVLVDDDTLALVGVRGAPRGAASRWASYPSDDSTPAGAALRAGRPLLWSDRERLIRDYPHLGLAASREESILCLPLVFGDRAVGVVTLSFPDRVEMDDAELEFFQAMADTCAQALERIRAQATVAEQNTKLHFLAEASEELANSLDYEATLKKVAELAVPQLADWCAISLEQDGVLRTLAVAHSDPDKVALARELQARYPTDPDAPSYHVLSTGESLLVPEVTDEMLVAAAQDETHLRMLRELNLHSGLTVALRARGRTFGVVSWINGENGRRFGPDDVALGEDIARRAAVAIDNSLVHSELREVADRLQAAVAPPALPDLEGWRLSASYRSAGRVSVGGDFYDAIPLHGDRLALVIGDVMGRGVEAAASMAQIRAALRAFVAVDPDPQVVLSRLDTLYERFPSEQLVTLVYALVDPSRDQVALTCAGHPPPLLLSAEGGAEYVESARGTILGVGRAERRRTVIPFRPGETLLLYTDGLLERRGEDLQVSKERLLNTVEALLPHRALADLDRLSAELRDPSRDDDVALLAATRLRRKPVTRSGAA
jgi:GAF domain-containing protein